jgi:hypothetical protein
MLKSFGSCEIVQHDHVEGRRGGALLLVAAHMNIVVITALETYALGASGKVLATGPKSHSVR